jgi:DNA repair protein RadC
MSQYVLKMKALPQEEKPRERLIAHGPGVLRNYELLAIILSRGTRKEGVLEMAHRIMDQYHPAFLEQDLTVEKVKALYNLGTVHACQLIATLELGRRLFQKGKEVYFRTPNQVWEYLKGMAYLTKEHVRALYLDVKNRLIREEVVSMGGLSSSPLHPREVIRPALLCNAAGIILAHNHPSGDPEPSPGDLEITARVKEACRLMEMELLDHIIVGEGGYVSLRERGVV